MAGLPDDKCSSVRSAGAFFECLVLSWQGLFKAVDRKLPFEKVVSGNKRGLFLTIDVALLLIVLCVFAWLLSSSSSSSSFSREGRSEPPPSPFP